MNTFPARTTTKALGTTSSLIALALAATAGYYVGSVKTAGARPTGITVATLIKTSQTTISQPISYPKGSPAQVTGEIFTIQPGASTRWHLHPTPQFAYILEGEIHVNYGDNTSKIYRKGTAIIEAVDHPHDGHNPGPGPVKILSVFMGAKGIKNTKPVPHPKANNPAAH